MTVGGGAVQHVTSLKCRFVIKHFPLAIQLLIFIILYENFVWIYIHMMFGVCSYPHPVVIRIHIEGSFQPLHSRFEQISAKGMTMELRKIFKLINGIWVKVCRGGVRGFQTERKSISASILTQEVYWIWNDWMLINKSYGKWRAAAAAITVCSDMQTFWLTFWQQ